MLLRCSFRCLCVLHFVPYLHYGLRACFRRRSVILDLARTESCCSVPDRTYSMKAGKHFMSKNHILSAQNQTPCEKDKFKVRTVGPRMRPEVLLSQPQAEARHSRHLPPFTSSLFHLLTTKVSRRALVACIPPAMPTNAIDQGQVKRVVAG